jgi:drug/metabolite transporter (DMT)-like permease
VKGAYALPAAALTFNALVWGVSWWPFRQLEMLGLHPLWSTAIIYGVAVLAISAWRLAAWRELASTPTLWVLVVASGATNASFNWAVTIGDVVRVVLLFYLMPLWAVLLARVLLHERFSGAAALRVVMSLAGAAIVLWPESGGWPLPRSLPDWLGVVGGFTFALNNVMLRREAARSESARALAMFAGGAVVSASLAGLLGGTAGVATPPLLAAGWAVPALAMGGLFLASNLALQYGAARLPANVTAVVMLTEVVFASGSALLLGAGTLTAPLVVGGGLIVASALLASRS